MLKERLKKSHNKDEEKGSKRHVTQGYHRTR